MKFELQYRQYNEKSILIEWPSKISEETLKNQLCYKKSIEKYFSKLIVEVILSYNSMLIYYVSTIEDVYSEVLVLKSLYDGSSSLGVSKKRLWKVPVCYSASLAPDLESFAEAKSLNVDQVIQLHTGNVYTVFFLGFLPGFCYLGGLDEKLFLDRKKSPSLTVEKGAVAIGGSQTGIYPQDSPGGWHVIGKSPLNFFDVKKENPVFVRCGDCIQFVSIEENVYNDISAKVEINNFDLNPTFL